ncbi:hypothetical protein FOZ60_001060 [Perkinsus olseni]|uniref:Uncharacterized protein n=1 Tax=Perkinsus olseni TaxID=32597 RepID=A0A7J6P200_PEROL|nr:hypothetical protein FOZ60_001060 [Perkinsus olseni]
MSILLSTRQVAFSRPVGVRCLTDGPLPSHGKAVWMFKDKPHTMADRRIRPSTLKNRSTRKNWPYYSTKYFSKTYYQTDFNNPTLDKSNTKIHIVYEPFAETEVYFTLRNALQRAFPGIVVTGEGFSTSSDKGWFKVYRMNDKRVLFCAQPQSMTPDKAKEMGRAYDRDSPVIAGLQPDDLLTDMKAFRRLLTAVGECMESSESSRLSLSSIASAGWSPEPDNRDSVLDEGGLSQWADDTRGALAAFAELSRGFTPPVDPSMRIDDVSTSADIQFPSCMAEANQILDRCVADGSEPPTLRELRADRFRRVGHLASERLKQDYGGGEDKMPISHNEMRRVALFKANRSGLPSDYAQLVRLAEEDVDGPEGLHRMPDGSEVVVSVDIYHTDQRNFRKNDHVESFDVLGQPVDYEGHIRNWLRVHDANFTPRDRAALPEINFAEMRSTTVQEAVERLYRSSPKAHSTCCYYLHYTNTEERVYFTNVTPTRRSSPLPRKSSASRRIHQLLTANSFSQLCNTAYANMVVLNDPVLPNNPTFCCKRCYFRLRSDKTGRPVRPDRTHLDSTRQQVITYNYYQ